MTQGYDALIRGLDPPLWLVTAQAGERRGGLIATTVCSASIVPAAPRMLVGVAKQHFTWQLVEASRAFALHLLHPHQQEWVWRFGLQSGASGDKLAGLHVRSGGGTGSPILRDALGWLECRVEAAFDTGDRSLFLAAVVDAQAAGQGSPLTLQRLLREAPAGKLEELRAQRQRDAEVDAPRIEAWRKRG